MRTCVAAALVAASAVCAGAASVRADTVLKYHGGPVLTSFTIYPLYYGDWSKSPHSIQDVHDYLVALADYVSGKGAPADQAPVLRQYGVLEAKVGPMAVASGKPIVAPAPNDNDPQRSESAQVRRIILDNQLSGKLPAFTPNMLIVVVVGPDTRLCGGFHAAQSPSAIYAMSPIACGGDFALLSHQIFQAAINPAKSAWFSDRSPEPAQPCSQNMGPGSSVGRPIAGVVDNTRDGACSTTAYAPIVPSGDAYGYLLADQPAAASYTPDRAFQFNSTGGHGTVTRASAGMYRVDLAGLAGAEGIANVTAHGDGSESCKLADWSQSTATVACFTAGGTAVDARFAISYAARKTHGDFAFIRIADAGAADGPVAVLQHNPYSATPQTVVRNAAGDYTIRIPDIAQRSGQDPRGGGGIAHVTAVGSDSSSCKPMSWIIKGPGIEVRVRCFTAAGKWVNSGFALTFHRKSDLLGRFSHDHAFGWVSLKQTVGSLPSSYQFNTQPGDLTMTRSATGAYAVKIRGQGRKGGHVQVTAYGSGPERCKVASWGHDPPAQPVGVDQIVEVRCFNAAGNAADSNFALSYIAP
jgi:hypothetical protein